MATKLGKILADFTTSLATALAVGGTSATLQSATDDDGVALPAGRYFFTLDGGNSSKEHISCDLSGTALTNIKTVSRQGVEAAGVVRTHRIGCTVTLTDFAHIKFINDLLSGATQLNSLVPLEYDGAPTISGGNMLATKTYVDTQISAGAGQASPTVQGIVEVATQAETDAGTATGGTGAYLIIPPSLLRAKHYHDYAVDSVGSDAYAITITPAITAYAAGQIFVFKAGTANTGACTLNVSGLGAKTIKKNVSSDLETGDILVNQIVIVVYDGTNMQLVNQHMWDAATQLSGLVPAANGGVNSQVMGVLGSSIIKNALNIQLPFTLYTGSTDGAATTDFKNWVRTGTDVLVPPMASMADFQGTGADTIVTFSTSGAGPFFVGNSTYLLWNKTNTIILDFMAKLPASGTGDIFMGFIAEDVDITALASNPVAGGRAGFGLTAAGALTASIGKVAVGVTNTDISSGLTLTNWNNYRVELHLGTDVKFYVNGVLKATLSGANLYTGTGAVNVGFGRSNTALFQVSAPNVSLQLI